MLDRFPTELLSHVVGLGAPLDYTPFFYLERREFLRNLCLVSKRMRDVEQPMLAEVYVVKSKEDAKQLKDVDDEEGRTRASKVKLLVLNWKTSNAATRDLRHLISHGRRTRLQSTATTTFPDLAEFSACVARFDPAFLATFLSVSMTPSLRAFGLVLADGKNVQLVGSILQRVSASLGSLDIVVLDTANQWSMDVYRMSPSTTVVDCQTSFVDEQLSSSAEIPLVLRLFDLQPHDTLLTEHASELADS
ncbi:hypothetical protein JCM8547_003218 [Rhodosporidiobolus lusitaniae]